MRSRHRWTEPDVVAVMLLTVLGVWTRSLTALGVGAVLALVVRRPVTVVIIGLLLFELAAWRSADTWSAARPRHLGAYAGWSRIVTDPTPVGAGVRITFEIEGERFDAFVYGAPRRRVLQRHAGEHVYVEGVRRALGHGAHRAQIRHVVGRFDAEVVGDWREGSPVARSAGRVRAALRTAAESTMGVGDAALFSGLAIGDDARQSPAMVDAFRTSGLSHLTAVSGENVAFLIAAASPVLRRLRPLWRWSATTALVSWFMALTQFEPSVLRAGFMAMLASAATLSGWSVQPVRVLSCTVVALVLIDPMLVWSVGFWLSAGATAGVCVLGPRLAAVLPGPPWFSAPLAVTLSAQAGVALPSILVFGRLPLISLPANLLAVPVAGFVMLAGIPAGLVAAIVPPLAPAVMLPCALATRWVATVAYTGASIEPAGMWSLAGWCGVLAATAWLVRRRHWTGRPADVPI